MMDQPRSAEATCILLGGELIAQLITMDEGPRLLRSIGQHSLAAAVEQQRRRGTSMRPNMQIVEKQEE